jgi:acyl-CoA synthetase (NDP forming)
VLEGFFAPESIVVVGVAREPGKVGHFVFQNLIEGGFAGEVWPVNPKADEILGRPCFPDVASLPSAPDLAIIAVPAHVVPAVVSECAAAGISSAIVLSAGFKETGPVGARLERDLAHAAAELPWTRGHPGASQCGVRGLAPSSRGRCIPLAVGSAWDRHS